MCARALHAARHSVHRHAIAGLRPALLEYVAANVAEIKDASPDTLDILRSHPDLMFAVMTSPPRAAKRQKTSA